MSCGVGVEGVLVRLRFSIAVWASGTVSSVVWALARLVIPLAFCASAYLIIAVMLPGFEDLVMTVVTPADVANRAATILVDMPPVPSAEPALDTSASRSAMSSTTSIALASGLVRGFLS